VPVYLFSSLFAAHSCYVPCLCVAQHNVEHLIGNSCLQSNYDCLGYEFRTSNQTHVISFLDLTFLFHSQIIKLTMRFEVLTAVNVIGNCDLLGGVPNYTASHTEDCND
jgi:hypothetical protein